MRVTNTHPFGRGRRPPALRPVNARSQRAAFIGALVGASVVALTACGAVPGTRLGAADLAGNSAAGAGSGTNGTTGATAGAPTAVGAAQAAGASGPTANGSGPTANGSGPSANGVVLPASGGVPDPSAGVPAADGGAPPSTGSAPAIPAAPSASAGSAESTANLPAGVQGLSCPLPGPPSGQVNSFGWGQAIPAGFQPVAAVQCVPNGSTPPPSGQLPYVHEEVAVAGLDPLLAALLEPSETPSESFPVPRCLAPATDVFQLALIGANGQVIEPLIPVTVCGGPIQPVVATIAALDWSAVN